MINEDVTTYPCPVCGRQVEWDSDDGNTWCDAGDWDGWGEELRLGQPGYFSHPEEREP